MANDRLTLQIDTVTTGTAQIEQLSAAMNRVVAQAEKAGQSGAAFSSFPSAVKSFVQDPLAAGESALTKFASGFGPVGIGVASGIAAFSALAVASASATRSLAAMGVETQNISIRTGLSTREVGQFAFAARATGADVASFETAMRKLSEGLVDSGEGGKKARESLDALHVTTRQITGDLKPTGQLFEEIGTALAAIPNAAERDKLAIDLFGRSALELIPTLVSLHGNLQKAQDLGLGISDAELARMKEFQEHIAASDAKWDLLKRHVSEGIAGTIWLDLKGSAADLFDDTFARALNGPPGSTPGPKSPWEPSNRAKPAGIPEGFRPGDPIPFSFGSLSPGELAKATAQINRDLDNTSTLAGAQQALKDAKEIADKARTDYATSASLSAQLREDKKRRSGRRQRPRLPLMSAR